MRINFAIWSSKMIDASVIEQMSPVERLQSMELLWKAISTRPQELSSPAWHGEVVTARVRKIKHGKGTFLTIDQLKKRIQKPRK